MPEYLAPGVYVEETGFKSRAIEGGSTSTAGFVGQTVRGPVSPILVTSWQEFVNWFGEHVDISKSYTTHSAKGFFVNGGRKAYIVRVTSSVILK